MRCYFYPPTERNDSGGTASGFALQLGKMGQRQGRQALPAPDKSCVVFFGGRGEEGFYMSVFLHVKTCPCVFKMIYPSTDVCYTCKILETYI